MTAIAPFVLEAITWAGCFVAVGLGIGVFECGKYLLIGEKPVAVIIVQIVAAVLEEDLDGLDRIFPDQRGIKVTTGDHRLSVPRRAISNGGVTPDHADDIA